MSAEMNKEKAVFLIGALLFVWVAIKLLLFLTHHTPPPGTPLAPGAAVLPGDPAIGNFLAPDRLDSYLERAARDPFAPPASEPAQFYVRAAISHHFLRSVVQSRYAFECRMSPTPVREVRFQLPTHTKVSDLFCKELDPERQWGADGRTLVVPVNPTLIKRAYYRCQITIVLQSPFAAPGTWTAPVISCAEATPNVQCEVGCIAVATPGDFVELTPKEGRESNLNRITLEGLPRELAALANKLAYEFRQANYSLVIDVKPKATTTIVAVPPKGGPPPLKPKEGPPPLKSKGEPPAVKQAEPPAPKLDIPKAADADALPFKLTAIVRIHEPEPRRQAVLRDKQTGEYFRKFEGDIVMADLRVVSISDDAVTIEDSKGKRYKFRGRFPEQYND